VKNLNGSETIPENFLIITHTKWKRTDESNLYNSKSNLSSYLLLPLKALMLDNSTGE